MLAAQLFAEVSPEFRLRPSLSGGTVGAEDRQEDRVAGVQIPAFVERPSACGWISQAAAVSPEFRLRPSLSVPELGGCERQVPRVAGVQTPAFVERFSKWTVIDMIVKCRRSSDSVLHRT